MAVLSIFVFKFPSETSAEFAHTIQNPDVRILLSVIPLPVRPFLLWHHRIMSSDTGLPVGSTIRSLYSLLKFHLYNFPPTLIIPSLFMNHL